MPSLSDWGVMPGVGHMPQIEDVEQFNRLLVAFLSKHAAKPQQICHSASNSVAGH